MYVLVLLAGLPILEISTLNDVTKHLSISKLGQVTHTYISFSVDICKVLHCGKGNMLYKYSICGQQLGEVESAKDLGIIFSKDLKVAAHCNEAHVRANHMLGLISRTIKYRNMESLTNLYKSLF